MAAYDATVNRFRAWLVEQGYAETTQRQYARVAERWLRSGLTPTAWLTARRAAGAPWGRAPTVTAGLYQKALVALHRALGLDVGAVPALPRVLRYRRVRPQTALSRAEEALVLAQLDQGTLVEPYAMIARLLLTTGLRQTEARRLRLVDIEAVPSGVRLRVWGKGSKERFVPVPPDLRPHLHLYLRGHRASRPGPWLFPGTPRRGQSPVGATALASAIERLRVAAGLLCRLTPHTCRHTLGTRMLEAGVQPEVAAAILGHSNVGQTREYQHPGAELMADALARAGR